VGELAELGIDTAVVEPGGATLEGDSGTIARLNLHLSSASRVLVTVGSFRATALGELERKAAQLDWSPFLRPGEEVAFRVTTRKSRLYHTGAVAERVARAAGGVMAVSAGADPESEDEAPGLLRSVEADTPARGFVVRIVRDAVTIRADATGEHLHRRGYRLQTGRAPLRETLAAGVLRLAGWDPETPLVDPLCGSGTFVIEAALRACRRAPGDHRDFAFQHWPGHDPDAWMRLRAEALRSIRPAPSPLVGSDRDAGAVAASRENAERAGIAGSVTFHERSVSEAMPPDCDRAGLLVSNPPWGRRVGDTAALRDLYARLGQVARRHFAGWALAIVSPEAPLVRQLDRRAECITSIPTGGLSVGIWRVDRL
jgi:putative N6-adenine-specific DNA methylase